MTRKFPILSAIECAVSRLSRQKRTEPEIAQMMRCSVKTVQRRLRSAADKRQTVAEIIRLGLLGENADEVIDRLGCRVGDLSSERAVDRCCESIAA